MWTSFSANVYKFDYMYNVKGVLINTCSKEKFGLIICTTLDDKYENPKGKIFMGKRVFF